MAARRMPPRNERDEKNFQEAQRKLRAMEKRTGKQAKPTTGEKLRDSYKENA